MHGNPFDIDLARKDGLDLEYLAESEFVFAADRCAVDWLAKGNSNERVCELEYPFDEEARDWSNPDLWKGSPATSEKPFSTSYVFHEGNIDGFLDDLIDSVHCWSHPVWGNPGGVWYLHSVAAITQGVKRCHYFGYPCVTRMSSAPGYTLIPAIRVFNSEEMTRNSQLYLDHWQEHPHSDDPTIEARLRDLLSNERMTHPGRETAMKAIYRFHEMIAKEGAWVFITGRYVCEPKALTAYLESIASR